MKKTRIQLMPIIAKLESIFFLLFLLTFTLSVRKIIAYFPIAGLFNEYMSLYVSLSDIFLFLTLLSWLICSLCNTNQFLSSIKQINCSTWNRCLKVSNTSIKKIINTVSRGTSRLLFSKLNSQKLQSVPRETDAKNNCSQVIHFFSLFFPLFAALFSFLSILWATNQTIALFRSVKLLEFILLFYYIKLRFVPHGTNLNEKLFHMEQNQNCDNSKPCSTWNNIDYIKFTFISFALIHTTIALIQFFLQHSVGLFWLKESFISQQTAGVAKVVFNNRQIIRSYGLFPHPNVLGGFLAITVIVLISMKDKICSIWNKSFSAKFVPCETVYMTSMLIFLCGLLITFSKSAIIGLILAIFYLKFKTVSRGTILWKSIRIKQAVLVLLIVFFSLAILKPDYYTLFQKSLIERVLTLNVSRETMIKSPLIGIGSGQFVPFMLQNGIFEPWQYQPVHNVFLLIASEYGIFLMILFVIFLSFKLNISSKSNNSYNSSLLIAITFIMLFDHYLWDIQQGSFLLWIILAII